MKQRGRKSTITVSREELTALRTFFGTELHLTVQFFAFSLITVATILFLAKLELSPDSYLIYVLYKLLIVTIASCCISGAYCILLLFAMFLIDRGKCRIFKTNKFRHCFNKRRGELKGKTYHVLHVLCFRYAFRIEDRS